jgi:hypothetical protein
MGIVPYSISHCPAAVVGTWSKVFVPPVPPTSTPTYVVTHSLTHSLTRAHRRNVRASRELPAPITPLKSCNAPPPPPPHTHTHAAHRSKDEQGTRLAVAIAMQHGDDHISCCHCGGRLPLRCACAACPPAAPLSCAFAACPPAARTATERRGTGWAGWWPPPPWRRHAAAPAVRCRGEGGGGD